MRYELFKILPKEFEQHLLEGYLYMNTLDYFRRYEENGSSAQKDYAEGTIGAVPKEQARQYGFDLRIDPKHITSETITLISKFYGNFNLFCLYALQIDDDKKTVFKPSDELYKFDEDDTERVVVRIKDTAEFLRRIDRAINKNVDDGVLEFGAYGHVRYSNFWKNADAPGGLSAFDKKESYSYQKEWRLCTLKKNYDDEALDLFIGDISDITETLSLEDFVNDIERIFPGYAVSEEPTKPFDEPYWITGTLDSTSKLMLSYSPFINPKIERSDAAQADWHYTQFLALNGRKDEIYPYLENRFQQFGDDDHCRLLIDYIYDTNDSDNALKTFDYCLSETPDVLRRNTDEFCFKLHQVFMKSLKPVLSAYLFQQAENKLELSDELSEIMQSDYYTSLGFYDKAVKIYEKMRLTNPDPIIEYYLGVAYFYLLDYYKAENHLKRYNEKFTSFPERQEKRQQLSTLLDIFKNGKEVKPTGEPVVTTDMEWCDEYDNAFSQKEGEYVLDFELIILLTKYGKWHLLEDCKSVVIVPIMILQLTNMYLHSADRLYYDAVESIRRMHNLKIISPETDRYIEEYMKDPALPEIYLTLKALIGE